MPLFSVDNVGELGLNSDLPASELPPNMFTALHNVRATKAGIESIYNYSDGSGFATCAAPFGVQYFENNAAKYWITASAVRITGHNGTSAVDLTTTWTAASALGVQLVPFQSLLIANSGTATPRTWDGVTFTAGAMTALSNWPASQTARVIRAFKNFLVALDVTSSGGTRYSKRILWSHPAEPGTVPTSWDPTDTTKDAGWQDLADTPGNILDCLPMGDVNMVYKTDAIIAMSYVTTNQIFRFSTIIRGQGALGVNCIAQFPGGHCVLTSGDVIIHDGTGRYQSIVSNRVRRAIFGRLHASNSDYAFVVPQPQFDEIWICLPKLADEGDSTYTCDLAYCWNYLTGAITTRDLPNVQAGALGYPRATAAAFTWATETRTWAEMAEATWNDPQLNSYKYQLMMVGYGTSALFLMDNYSSTVQIPDGYAERIGLAVVGQKKNGEFKVDTTSRKIVVGLWPSVTMSGNMGSITVSVGGQEKLSGPVEWVEVEDFVAESFTDFGEDTSADPQKANELAMTPLVNTPIPAFRVDFKFSTLTFGKAKLLSYDMEINPAGKTW